VSIDDDIAFIERVPTLRMLGRPALRILAIGAESRYLHQGEMLFAAGEPADCGYIIQQGAFRLDSDSQSAEDVIGEPGTLLGELALITPIVRPATAIALEPSTVIRISRSLFLKMLEGYPEAANVLREHIAARTQQSLSEITNVRARLDIDDLSR
jgi:CRP-like cAMP-binding protein